MRNLRVAGDVWEPTLEAARERADTITNVLTQFLRWYLRVPGAKLPNGRRASPTPPSPPIRAGNREEMP